MRAYSAPSVSSDEAPADDALGGGSATEAQQNTDISSLLSKSTRSNHLPAAEESRFPSESASAVDKFVLARPARPEWCILI